MGSKSALGRQKVMVAGKEEENVRLRVTMKNWNESDPLDISEIMPQTGDGSRHSMVIKSPAFLQKDRSLKGLQLTRRLMQCLLHG